MKTLLLIGSLLISSMVYAGQDGNGGYSIQCGANITTLDLYEATHRYHYKVDLGPANLSVDEKVEIMLKRLEKINAYTAKVIRKLYLDNKSITTISNDNIMIDGKVVFGEGNPALDVGDSIYPNGCKLLPLARTIPLSETTRIFYRKSYYDRLDNNNKAAIQLHETLYKHLNPDDSQPIRQLVALLASSNVESMSSYELQQALYNLNGYPNSSIVPIEINHFAVNNNALNFEGLTKYANGKIKSVPSVLGAKYGYWSGQDTPLFHPWTSSAIYPLRPFQFHQAQLLILPRPYNQSLDFFEDGTPKVFRFVTDLNDFGWKSFSDAFNKCKEAYSENICQSVNSFNYDFPYGSLNGVANPPLGDLSGVVSEYNNENRKDFVLAQIPNSLIGLETPTTLSWLYDVKIKRLEYHNTQADIHISTENFVGRMSFYKNGNIKEIVAFPIRADRYIDVSKWFFVGYYSLLNHVTIAGKSYDNVRAIQFDENNNSVVIRLWGDTRYEGGFTTKIKYFSDRSISVVDYYDTGFENTWYLRIQHNFKKSPKAEILLRPKSRRETIIFHKNGVPKCLPSQHFTSSDKKPIIAIVNHKPFELEAGKDYNLELDPQYNLIGINTCQLDVNVSEFNDPVNY